MKKVKLSSLKDGTLFKRVKYSDTFYKLIKKEGRNYVFTSLNTEKSYVRSGSLHVFVGN